MNNNNSNITNQGGSIGNNNNGKETEKTLDMLFKKTKTKPNIYFLPLAEEEV